MNIRAQLGRKSGGGEDMATKARECPNNIKEYRDLSAEKALEGINALRPLLEEDADFDEAEIIRRVARAANCLQEIARNMVYAGAQIRG